MHVYICTHICMCIYVYSFIYLCINLQRGGGAALVDGPPQTDTAQNGPPMLGPL